MAFVITEPCIGTKDASCVEVCPVDCIHSTDDAPQYYIDPETCISCGACQPVCPVQAIYDADSDLPKEYEKYIQINAAFFGYKG
jgi:ferredoxin